MQGFSRPLAIFLISVLTLLATAGCVGDGFGGASGPAPALPACEYKDPVVYQLPENFEAINNRLISYQYDPNAPLRLQTDSYTLLVYEMMKWSVQKDVMVKGATYRFTITLLSPELMTSIIWAEVINHRLEYSNVPLELNKWISNRIGKKQVFFLLTINTSDQGALTEPGKQAIRFPIGDMTLTTMSGLKTSGPQGEGVFAYDLDSYDNPIRYYFYFPTAVLVEDNQCTQLFDPGQDLTFTLGISTVRINGELIGDLSWNFELAHLLNIARQGDPLSFSSTTQVIDNPYIGNTVFPVCSMPTAAVKTNAATPTHLAGDINYWLPFSLCAWETISGIP